MNIKQFQIEYKNIVLNTNLRKVDIINYNY